MSVAAADKDAMIAPRRGHLVVFIVAGEHSGDALGAKLMAALNAMRPGGMAYAGLGGEHMQREGLVPLFPLAEVAVMGPLAILKRLPRIVRRVYETADAGIAARPDVVVIIDSPEFTHPIARRIRRRLPEVPIIDYVSPSVWAWRPGRAARMRGYVDHVLAILPFEPDVHRRLGGPPCTYVGHSLAERVDWIRSRDGAGLVQRLGVAPGRQVLVVLPGSRPSEVGRLMQPFGEAVGLIAAAAEARGEPIDVVLPVVESVRELVAAHIGDWPVKPHIVSGEEDKFATFRAARAALAASGTVTLELAVAGTPMVVAYKVDALAARLRFLVKTRIFALANLVLGDLVFPELMQEECTPGQLAAAVDEIMTDGPARSRQLAALARVPGLVALSGGTPSESAARIVLAHAEAGRAAAPQ